MNELGPAGWPTLAVHTRPFRLGLDGFRWGVVVRLRGRYRAYGRREQPIHEAAQQYLRRQRTTAPW